MTPVLTPDRALEYLRQLSADVRDGVVLATDGTLLAGEEAVAAPARELLAALPDPEVEVTTAGGVVFAARSARHAVVLACGTFALSGLQRHDLRTVLADLEEPAEAAA